MTMGIMPPFYTYKILFRVFRSSFLGAKNKEEQAAEMVKSSIISAWVSFFGTPGIMMAGADSRFIGGFQDFALRLT